MTASSGVSTGDRVLDTALRGGFPRNRTTLLTGTPGTGKSTLAMQFLQEGLANGETCLFISTEQTFDELRTGFAPFEFDLTHENLAITTLHAAPGETLESDEQELTLRTLDAGEEVNGGTFGIPFSSKYIREHLEQYGPCDRVVLDSVSGLEMIDDQATVYRRAVLDLIRLFTEGFEATAVLTAEHTGVQHPGDGVERVGTSNAVQFNVNGVIRLWRELVGGDYHRFLDIMKMRGVDHDTRRYEIEFSDVGVDIIPRRRFHSPNFIDHEFVPTEIPGLDELIGGGLLQGAGTLLEHDGQANFDVLLSRLILQALGKDMGVTLVPTVDMNRRRVEQLMSDHPKSVTQLLDANELFVIDMVGAWDADHEHVFDVQREEASLRYILQTIEERAATDGLFYVLNTEAKVYNIGREEARSFRYWLEANYISTEDLHLDVHNPNLMADDLAAFYVDAAGQVLRTWMDDSGLQYLELSKSPIGSVGSTRLIEYLDDRPFLRIQQQ